MKRPSFVRLLAVGATKLRRYTGMFLAVYLVGLLPSLAVGVLTARALAARIAAHPICDDLLGGDLVTVARCLGDATGLVASLGTSAVLAVIAHALISWFLIAGVVTVLTARCHDRREVAERFGAGGASRFGAFARLSGWSVPLWLVVGFAALIGMAVLVPPIERVLSLGELILRVLLALAPAALIALWLSAAVAYARIDLVRHRELSALRALFRGARLVTTRPLLLAHAALGPMAFSIVTAAYLALTVGRPLLGLGGALTLLALRQLTALLRFAASVVVLAGQVEASETVVFPPGAKGSADEDGAA